MKKRVNWPSKQERENWEIEQFIRHYERATSNIGLRVYLKSERPDYGLVSDILDKKYGVELTSVYQYDRSVPDNHIPLQNDFKDIPYVSDDVERYLLRVLDAIQIKDKKARSGYSTEYPLLLSVYINEYLAIHIDSEQWSEFFLANNFRVEDSAFQAILLWPLPGDHELILCQSSVYIQRMPMSKLAQLTTSLLSRYVLACVGERRFRLLESIYSYR
ncbi:MAG: hypothetical protein R3E73_13590 [Porticoccaceae bacterium]|nr:hypothetical protein [Pseudomonadales bacterium]MCP5173291.1 hypothetical protein [Pseudomonadales bacterium]